MKNDDFVFCSTVLKATTKLLEPHVRVKKILNHQLIKELKNEQNIQQLSKKLYRTLDLLKYYELIEITESNPNGHPSEFKLTPKGYDVKNSTDKLKEHIDEIDAKKQQEAERLSKSHELIELQLSKIKEELASEMIKKQDEFYQKSIADLTNKLDEKARAIEKKLKTTTIWKNKIQMVIIIASFILSILAFSKSMGWI